MKPLRNALATLAVAINAAPVHADAVDALQAFARDVHTAQAGFTQTVTSPDGAKKKTSQGTFEFERPNRFRFDYTKPFQQQIVADGNKVWIYDADLNQVSTRPLAKALGATPAALLAGSSIERDFTLKGLAAKDGLEWVEATPKAKEGASFQAVRVGFRGRELAAFEILDSFGQRSLLEFRALTANGPIDAQRFKFVVPSGADVIEQ